MLGTTYSSVNFVIHPDTQDRKANEPQFHQLLTWSCHYYLLVMAQVNGGPRPCPQLGNRRFPCLSLLIVSY